MNLRRRRAIWRSPLDELDAIVAFEKLRGVTQYVNVRIRQQVDLSEQTFCPCS